MDAGGDQSHNTKEIMSVGHILCGKKWKISISVTGGAQRIYEHCPMARADTVLRF